MRPATLNAIFPKRAYLLLLLLNFVNGERSVCRRSTGSSCKENITINAKCLRTRSTGRTFFKWHLTLTLEALKNVSLYLQGRVGSFLTFNLVNPSLNVFFQFTSNVALKQASQSYWHVFVR